MPKLNCKHANVLFVVHRLGEHRRVHSTCQDCGLEWVEDEAVEDLADTVTSNEIVAVHEALADPKKTLTELIE